MLGPTSMFTGKYAKYVYSELAQVSQGTYVIILHLELTENKPTERKTITIDEAYELKGDLERELNKYENINQ